METDWAECLPLVGVGVVNVWKTPAPRLRKEGAVVPDSVNHLLPPQPIGRQGHLLAKEALIFQSKSFGILTGSCIFPIAGRIRTPKAVNIFSR